jgi:hypothetical protein
MSFIPEAHAQIVRTSNLRTSTEQPAEQQSADSGGGFLDGLSAFFGILFTLILIVFAFAIVLKIMRFAFEVFSTRNLIYLRVSLPRADSKLDKERETKKDFKEKIGIMSVVYKGLHKISAITFWETMMDAIFYHSKFSMELVYDQGQVSFGVVSYASYRSIIVQQITANYPDAEVRELSKDEFFEIKPRGYTLRAASVSKAYDNIYPLKTFKYFEDDPLSTFTNAFGGLNPNDKAVIQFVVKPVGSGWNRKAKNAAGLVAKGLYKKGIGASGIWGFIGTVFAPVYWILRIFVENETPPDSTGAPGAATGDSYKIFNQAEQESQKAVGEAAGQPGFTASIRILVSSEDEEKVESALSGLILATSVFTDEYNNKLDNPQIEDLFSGIVAPIRYFAYTHRLVGFLQGKSIFSTDELSSMYHFPDIAYNRSPLIKWLDYKMLPPPHNLKMPKTPMMMTEYKRDKNGNVVTEDGTLLSVDENKNIVRDEDRNFVTTDGETVEVYQDGPDKGKPVDAGKTPVPEERQRTLGGFPLYKDGVLMGWNEYRSKKTPVYFNRKDRGRHHYIIGKSGGGKSVFIGYIARQDLWNGNGLCVIDPHGDLVEDILAFTPKERAKDVVVFNPGDFDRPMGLNILDIIATDPKLRAVEKDRAALDATSIFIKIFNEEVFGPRIQHYFRNGALTLMDDDEEGGTLIDVPRLFVDDAFMRYKVSKVKNPVVRSFWEHEYANTGDREKQEMIPYFSAKFGPFITNTTIRNIIGQPKSAFNLRQVMDEEKVLMVNLSKGLIGDLNAQLLGLIFVSKINMAAMSRADTPEPLRKDFYLYVDEFQNFATDTFGEILSEARKYKLALIMAHQFIAQIGGNAKNDGKPSIKDAVFGNAGTIMSFKVGAEDAEYLEKEYAPLLSQQDIIGIANFTTYCKLNIDNATTRPFDMKTLWDNTYKNTNVAQIIKEYSRKVHGRKKEYVDMDIEARLGMSKPETVSI